MLLLILASVVGGAVGCGTGYTIKATPAGTSTVTVMGSATATGGSPATDGSSSGTHATHIANFTLTIKP